MTTETNNAAPLSELPRVSVVVPVYNGAASISELAHRVQTVLRNHVSWFELILVNDGSPDDSWGSIESLTRTDAAIRGINLMRNYGQHNALLCGIRAADGDLILTLDDDLQNPPEEIPKLLAAMTDGVDLVYGTPEVRRQTRGRRIGAAVLRGALRSIMPKESADKASAFRLFRTPLRSASDGYRGDFVSIDVLLGWATTKIVSVRVRHDVRQSGRSAYDLVRLVGHAMDMVTGFSTVPLRLASLLGLVFTGFGGALLTYVIGRYLVQGTVVPGFAFLASSVTMFSGVQLFCLGIIGEYIARMHQRAMERPTYAVRETTQHEDSGSL